MRRSKRLQVVLDLAKRKEEEALKALQIAQGSLSNQNQKLQELTQYQRDYQQSLRDAYQTHATAESCATYQHFLAQVGAAIEQQQQAVALAEQQFDKVRVHWLALHEKQQGMGSLIDRFRDEEDKELDKKEQKMIDELSQRIRH